MIMMPLLRTLVIAAAHRPGRLLAPRRRCRMAIWWRSTRISVFLTLSERGSRASQPHSRTRIR